VTESEEVLESMVVPDLHTVQVHASTGAYTVHVGRGGLDRIGAIVAGVAGVHRCALIADDTVAGLYASRVTTSLAEAGLECETFTFPAGEENKTRKSWSILTDSLLDGGFGRDSLVLALGGGVTGDLAGFVAATYMRGLPVIQVPTSVVAMVDSSVGGKTGVDTGMGKNLVGSFHPPLAVVIDPMAIDTLPRGERSQGWVEAVKHGAISDAEYLGSLVSDSDLLLAGGHPAVERAVLRSVQIKAEVVTQDEREGEGRMALNFGHTFGHAIEAASEYSMGHGSAVAAGMVLEAELGEHLGVTEYGTALALAGALQAIEIVPRLPERFRLDALEEFLFRDKKAREGKPRFVMLRRVGEVDREFGWTRAVPREDIEAVLGSTQLRD
jgi:3-dehydroquinate synthase